jgi:Holliday junction resolvasome RuvABC endonuclease subunit
MKKKLSRRKPNDISFEGVHIIGMDPPSSRNCGWAVIYVRDGELELVEKFTQVLCDDPLKRLDELYGELDRMVKTYSPVVLCLEYSSGGGLSFVRSGLNEAVGVTKLCCYRNGLPVAEVSPAHLKSVIGGHGRADKNCIMANIAATFSLAKTGVEHECDAVAFAITYMVDKGWTGYSVKVPFDDGQLKKDSLALKNAIDAGRALSKSGTPHSQLGDMLVSLGYKKPVVRKALAKLKTPKG